MSRATSEEVYTYKNGNNLYTMKASAIGKEFKILIKRSNPYENHDYQEDIVLTPEQAKQLKAQLEKFIYQN